MRCSRPGPARPGRGKSDVPGVRAGCACVCACPYHLSQASATKERSRLRSGSVLFAGGGAKEGASLAIAGALGLRPRTSLEETITLYDGSCPRQSKLARVERFGIWDLKKIERRNFETEEGRGESTFFGRSSSETGDDRGVGGPRVISRARAMSVGRASPWRYSSNFILFRCKIR